MDVQQCIRTIEGKPTGLFNFRVSSDEKIACIAELAHYKDLYLGGIIIPATRDEDPLVRMAATAAVTARFQERVGAREVEEGMRSIFLNRTDPALWCRTLNAEQATALVCIASVNYSGYVRQAALEQMSVTIDRRYIPFMLRRAGDWVPQVREQALKALAHHQTADLRKDFLVALRDIASLLQVKRIDLVAVYRDIMDWLLNGVPTAQLLAEVGALEDASRFIAVRFILAERMCEEMMLRSFLADRSFLIRLAAVRHLVGRSEDWANVLLEGALKDPFQSVRKTAFREIIHRGRASRPMLVFGTTDASFDIRKMSVMKLEWSRDQLLEHYKDGLKVGERVAGCLLGLADIKSTEVVQDLIPYTGHVDPFIRRAALTALALLAPYIAFERAMVMIVDTNKRIRSKAEALLLERHDEAVFARARELMNSDIVMHRLMGLSLINRFGGWRSLADLIHACLDPSSRVADQAWVDLDAWIVYARRLFTDADPTDLERARTAMDRVRNGSTDLSLAKRKTLGALQAFLT